MGRIVGLTKELIEERRAAVQPPAPDNLKEPGTEPEKQPGPDKEPEAEPEKPPEDEKKTGKTEAKTK